MTASVTDEPIGHDDQGVRGISAAQWRSGLAAWLGWALGGGHFGRFGDRLGRSRTLLRTTGAGLCYTIGRIASAVGTVAFGPLSAVPDNRTAAIAAGCLFLPAGSLALGLPDLDDRDLH